MAAVNGSRDLEMREAYEVLRRADEGRARRVLDSISLELSDRDEMFVPGQAAHYLRVGLSAISCIEEVITAAGVPFRPRSILDFPCGHGRVQRYLKAAFPDATITGADTNSDGVAFCAHAFGAHAYQSGPSLTSLVLPNRYDLIWCGSLLTHLPEPKARDLLELFAAYLEPGGLCVFTTHGDGAVDRLRDGIYSYGLNEDQRTKLLRNIVDGEYAFCELEQDYGIAFARADRVRALVKGVSRWEQVYWRPRGWDDHQDVFGFRAGAESGAFVRARRTAKRWGRLFR